MPNKDFIKKFVFALISILCSSLTSASQGQAAGEPKSEDSVPCVYWRDEPDTLAVGHLCVVSVPQSDVRPLYLQQLGRETFKFLFNQVALALAVQPDAMATLRKSTEAQSHLVATLTEDRLAIWHNDAIYWWRWLQHSQEKWSGSEDS